MSSWLSAELVKHWDNFTFTFNSTTFSVHRRSLNLYFCDLSREDQLGSPMRRCENNIKMNIKEIGREGVHYINLVQDRDKGRTLGGTVMKLRVPQNNENLTSQATSSCSRRILCSMQFISQIYINLYYNILSRWFCCCLRSTSQHQIETPSKQQNYKPPPPPRTHKNKLQQTRSKKHPNQNVQYRSAEQNTSLNNNVVSNSNFNLDFNQILILLVILKQYTVSIFATDTVSNYGYRICNTCNHMRMAILESNNVLWTNSLVYIVQLWPCD
jgi:hypothetical protein